MSTLRIQEEVEFDAPPERVWHYLIDPERVVTCLPGATIDSWDGQGSYQGSIKLKVGPANMTYQGAAEFVEVDEDRLRMRLEGKGRETGGAGRVQMSMESTVEALADGGSRVVVEVELKLAGKIVRFGRGMIGVVSERMFKDFAACLAERLAMPVGETNVTEASAAPEAVSGVRLLVRALWMRLLRLFGAGD